MRRNKGFTVLNLTGLSVGLACCFLIAAFIMTERSFDRYHVKAERIHRMWAVLTLGGTPNDVASINAPPGPAMREEYPEVEDAVRFRRSARVSVKALDREFYEDRIMYADASVFNVFSFAMIRGDPGTALEAPYTVVLTESAARRYFKEEDPVGRSLRFGGKDEYQVTGIIADVPENSHFLFDMLCSFETLVAGNRQYMESWFSAFGYHTYLLLRKDADPAALEAELPAFVDRHMREDLRSSGADVAYHLQPLTGIHLHSRMRHEISPNSDAKYIAIFAAIGGFILLIACFNFMNLTAAQISVREKEVGMRKVLGATRRELVRHYLTESVVFALLSLAAGWGLAEAALPVFRALSDRPLSIPFFQIPWLAPGFLALAVASGLLAGGPPALHLAGVPALGALQRRATRGARAPGFRRTLVTTQFVIAVTLIIATAVVFSQLRYMKNIDLGFNMDRVVVIPIQSQRTRDNLDSIKSQLTAFSGISAAAASSHVPGGRRSGGAYLPEGYPDGRREMMDGMVVDPDYIDALGMEIVAGRNFSRDFATDADQAILINQAAARAIGWTDPLGKTIRFSAEEPGKTVVGVVGDFFFQSPHARIAPLYISNSPFGLFEWRTLFVRIRPGRVPTALEFLEKKWATLEPGHPFDYTFLDATYRRQYRADEKLSAIFTWFTLVAIVIACLGLFGMSSFAARRRTREIGIRKVLGASQARIVSLLGAELVRTAATAAVFTWPLAYVLMKRWLEAFPYRTGINPLIFLLSTALMFFIGCVTIAFQTLRSARADPVAALRCE